MAEIRAFKGVRYNQAEVGDLSAVVAPPYDVIAPEEEDSYWEQSPYNVIRLALPRENGGNKYVNAAAFLRRWLSDRVLIQDEKPALYVYQQEFEALARRMKRLGFTCLVRLEELGKGSIFPHENIMAKPLEDRLNLMRAARANLDSVFGLYHDTEVDSVLRRFAEGKPAASATDRDGVRSDLWRITDPDAISAITGHLERERIVIADGHHRYSAAVAYRNEMRELAGIPAHARSEAPYDYLMMTLIAFEDPGLVVLPVHRLVRNVVGFDAQSLLAGIAEIFDMREVPDDLLAEEVERSGDFSFGVHLRERSLVIKLKPSIAPEKAIQSAGSDGLKRLDVSVLHSLILDRILGIGAQQMTSQLNLNYTRGIAEAMGAVDRGEAQALFVMNPTKVEEVRVIAGTGEKMPQKSTYFYPKLLSGLLMRVMPRLDASR